METTVSNGKALAQDTLATETLEGLRHLAHNGRLAADTRATLDESVPRLAAAAHVDHLLAQIATLQEDKNALEQRRWLDSTLARFGQLMRWQPGQRLADWADAILHALAQELGCMQGTFYQLAEQGDRLTLLASYATSPDTPTEIALGEGLAGQAALDGQQVYFGEQVPFFATSASVLARVEAQALVIQPLTYNGELAGLIELTTWQALHETQRELLRLLAEPLAAQLRSIRTQDQIQTLYQAAQHQREALVAQEEELRQNLEELQATQEQIRLGQERSEAQRAQVQAIIDSAPGAILAIDRNLRLTHFNKAFVALQAANGREVEAGIHVDQCYDMADREDALAVWNRALRGEQFVLERSFHRAGQRIETVLETTFSPVHGRQGEVLGAVAFANDISARLAAQREIQQTNEALEAQQEELRQNLEELEAIQEQLQATLSDVALREAQLQAMINAHDRAIVSVDRDMRLLHFNGHYALLAQLSGFQELRPGFTLPQFVSEALIPIVTPLIERSLAGEQVQVELQVAHLPGEPWIKANFLPIRDHQEAVTGVVCLLRDVTMQRQLKLETEARQERLARQEQALGRLASSALLSSGDVQAAQELITRTISHTLDIGQVGIWLYEASNSGIRSAKVYNRPNDAFSAGVFLGAEQFPSYFAAVGTGNLLVVDNKRHPAVAEFQDYFAAFGIGAMLDIPLRRNGQLIGVICCEHLGGDRTWHVDEQRFLVAVAEMIALSLEAAERHQAAQQRDAAWQWLTQLMGVITVDADGNIASINPVLVQALGTTLRSLKGKPLSKILSGDVSSGMATLLGRNERWLVGTQWADAPDGNVCLLVQLPTLNLPKA